RVLGVSPGEIGERWQELAAVFGCDVIPLTYAWGDVPTPDDLRGARAEGGAGPVFLAHSETSTGVVCDLEPLLAVCRDAGALSVVGAGLRLGGVPPAKDGGGGAGVV